MIRPIIALAVASSLAAAVAAPVAAAAPPETTIKSAPPAFTNLTSAQFEFESVPAGGTFACRLDDEVGFSACQTPRSIENLTEAEHTLRVKATVSGETDDSPAVHKWTVDLTPPDTTITRQPDAAISSQSATFEFASPSGEPVVFRCSLDGAAFSPCESPSAYSELAEGAHQFSVRARDRAGNIDTTAPSASWTVDITPPDTAITQRPPALSNVVAPQIGFVTGEAGATIQCSLNGAEFAACSSPLTLTTGVHEGENGFQARAVDAAGNLDPTPARMTWVQDTVAPKPPSLRVGAAPKGATPPALMSQAPFSQGTPQAVFTPPEIPFALGTATFQLQPRLGVTWAADGPADGLKFDLQVFSTPGPLPVGWNPPAPEILLTATALTHTTYVATPGLFYCFQARATDAAGNASARAMACTSLPHAAKQLVSQYGTGAYVKLRKAKRSYRGRFWQLSEGWDSYVQLKLVDGTFVRRVSVVATTCKTCGTVAVQLVDGKSGKFVPGGNVHNVSLRSTKTRPRRLIKAIELKGVPRGMNGYITVKRVSGKPRIEGVAISPL